MLKDTYNILSQFLLSLFNKLLSKAEYPSTLGHGILVPIFKSGDPTEAKNYRGITLTNIIAKIYSTLLSNRLSHWAKENNTFTDNQYGFQKGKSTFECIFVLNALITKTLEENKKLYVAFLDKRHGKKCSTT